MDVKIDTKEKFVEFSILEPALTANMTEEIRKMLDDVLKKPVKNLILLMDAVQTADIEAGQAIAELQNQFYEQSASFVICGVQPAIEAQWDEAELLEMLNITPTLSEAWDIVQMEEIERELLDGME